MKETENYNLKESLKESVQELSSYDNHPADTATETFEREKDLGIYLDSKRLRYNNIQDALDRIKAGKYGICAICGRPIAQERLEALPQTINCIDCQELMEKGQIGDGNRPIEEIVLAYPFGRSFLRDTTAVGFDGEDTWQAVAIYGTSETDRKSTRLNSSHVRISYAVFCLKKKRHNRSKTARYEDLSYLSDCQHSPIPTLSRRLRAFPWLPPAREL